MDDNSRNELERLRKQISQQEKMASLGLLSAGIAHEIQNPLNFVINFSKLSRKLLEDMEDVLEIREALDELAVKIACDKISEKELQKLLEVKDQFENSTKTGDVKMIAEMDVKFHDVIFESTGNPKLVTLLNNLREQIYRYRVEYIKNPDNYPVLIAEHNAIAEGLKNRDKEAATLAMHKHVKNQAVAVKSVIQCQDEAENE